MLCLILLFYFVSAKSSLHNHSNRIRWRCRDKAEGGEGEHINDDSEETEEYLEEAEMEDYPEEAEVEVYSEEAELEYYLEEAEMYPEESEVDG